MVQSSVCPRQTVRISRRKAAWDAKKARGKASTRVLQVENVRVGVEGDRRGPRAAGRSRSNGRTSPCYGDGGCQWWTLSSAAGVFSVYALASRAPRGSYEIVHPIALGDEVLLKSTPWPER